MDQSQCTVASLADFYVEEALVGRHKATGKPMALSTIYNERRAIGRSIKPLVGNLHIADLTDERMQEVVDWTSRSISTGEALVARQALRNISNFAAFKEIIRMPHGQAVRAEAHIVQKTPLTNDEFCEGWNHIRTQARTGALPTQITANSLLLMISTLQAPMALIAMRIDEIDFEGRVWRKPVRTVAGVTSICIPLSERSLGFIADARRHGITACGDNPWVFPATHRGGHGERPISEKTPSVMMRRTRREAGIADIGPQRFFDTGEAWLRSCWTHPDIIKTMLGRVGGMHPDLLKAAVDGWDGQLTKIVAGG